MKKMLHYLNYRSPLIKSRDWQEIIDYYDELVNKYQFNSEPMLNIIKYISANYSYGIYATTSMFTLCVAQTPKFDLNKNVLRIDFSDNRFEFVYIDPKKTRLSGWKKICSAEQGISTFEHIMKRLKWFTVYEPSSNGTNN